jgi:hypothetical protein
MQNCSAAPLPDRFPASNSPQEATHHRAPHNAGTGNPAQERDRCSSPAKAPRHYRDGKQRQRGQFLDNKCADHGLEDQFPQASLDAEQNPRRKSGPQEHRDEGQDFLPKQSVGVSLVRSNHQLAHPEN